MYNLFSLCVWMIWIKYNWLRLILWSSFVGLFSKMDSVYRKRNCGCFVCVQMVYISLLSVLVTSYYNCEISLADSSSLSGCTWQVKVGCDCWQWKTDGFKALCTKWIPRSFSIKTKLTHKLCMYLMFLLALRPVAPMYFGSGKHTDAIGRIWYCLWNTHNTNYTWR